MKKIGKKELRTKEVESKMSDAMDSINEIVENLPGSFGEFSRLGLVKDGIYKKTEFAIENILDICNIINADLRLGIPETEEDVLRNLKKAEIFDEKAIGLIEEIKRFRNVLVHKYGKINDEQAFNDIVKGVKDFKIISEEIEDFLRKH